MEATYSDLMVAQVQLAMKGSIPLEDAAWTEYTEARTAEHDEVVLLVKGALWLAEDYSAPTTAPAPNVEDIKDSIETHCLKIIAQVDDIDEAATGALSADQCHAMCAMVNELLDEANNQLAPAMEAARVSIPDEAEALRIGYRDIMRALIPSIKKLWVKIVRKLPAGVDAAAPVGAASGVAA